MKSFKLKFFIFVLSIVVSACGVLENGSLQIDTNNQSNNNSSSSVTPIYGQGTSHMEMGLSSSGYLYVADYSNTLNIYNTNANSIVHVGTALTKSISTQLIPIGNYMYSLEVGSALVIYDISNPTDIEQLSSVAGSASGFQRSLAVSGNYAYSSSSGVSGVGVEIIDISNKNSPSVVATYGTQTQVSGVDVSGSLMVIAAEASGIVTVDISNPLAPVQLDTDTTSSNAVAVKIIGNYAYIIDGTNSLDVYDISTPSSISFVTNLAGVGTYGSLSLNMILDGDKLYIQDADVGLSILDVSTPNSPSVIATIPALAFYNDLAGNTRGGLAIDSANNRLFGSDENNVYLYDISNPASPSLTDTEEGWKNNDGVAINSNGVAIKPSTYGNHCFYLWDVSDIYTPNPKLGTFTGSGGNCWIAAIDANYAYVADTNTFKIVDISNTASPTLAGSVALSASGRGDMSVVGNYAFVRTDNTGIDIIDISNKASPSNLSTYAHTFSTRLTVHSSGNYVYTADGSSNLVVIDTTNKAAPAFVTNLALSGNVQAFSIENDTLVVGLSDNSFSIIDISTPASPTLVHNYAVASAFWGGLGILVKDNKVFFFDVINGLTIYDITTPTSPSLFGQISYIGYINKITSYQNFVYYLNPLGRMITIDMDNFSETNFGYRL